MRWSEPLTIYLAAGASFGVSRYLHAAGRARSRRRAVAEGMAAALLWPLAAAAILTKRLRHACEDGPAEGACAGMRARVEDARRNFVSSVNKMLEIMRASRMTMGETLEQTLYAMREGAEQYVGLAGMFENADEKEAPAAHEAELARLCGRRGDDLSIAARCLHRRNVSRVRAHYHRERSRLLRKLAELRARDEDDPLSYAGDDARRAVRRKLSEARLEIYLRATDLFSLLEDERAARGAAQLTDAECLTLRRLRETDEAAVERASGVEKCTEHARPLMSKDPLSATTCTRG